MSQRIHQELKVLSTKVSRNQVIFHKVKTAHKKELKKLFFKIQLLVMRLPVDDFSQADHGNNQNKLECTFHCT